jgi:hypothetical protein
MFQAFCRADPIVGHRADAQQRPRSARPFGCDHGEYTLTKTRAATDRARPKTPLYASTEILSLLSWLAARYRGTFFVRRCRRKTRCEQL